jgi:hypothetical protein
MRERADSVRLAALSANTNNATSNNVAPVYHHSITKAFLSIMILK